jgi:hypothetical protein
MECSKGVAGTAFVQTKQNSFSSDTNICHEIVLCTNRHLQGGYKASGDSSSLLDQWKDLPPRLLKAVEEALAHQLSILHDQNFSSQKNSNFSPLCEQYAELEL